MTLNAEAACRGLEGAGARRLLVAFHVQMAGVYFQKRASGRQLWRVRSHVHVPLVRGHSYR